MKKEPKKAAPPKLGQVGARPVGPIGIVLISVYLILLFTLLLYCLVKFWPPTAPADAEAPVSSSVNLFFWTFSISNEISLLLIVAFAGALGGLVHTLRSLYWYVGNRELVLSWLMMYIMRPFIGATLGIVFYFVIRGGFFSPEATVQQTSPFSFVALASLVGMFSEQAVLKLKDLAETLLTKPEPGENHKPQEKV